MRPIVPFEQPLTPEQAITIQNEWASKVICVDQYDKIKYIAGVDVAYHTQKDILIAAIVILDANTLQCIEKVTVQDQVHFPYIPGLFSFREIPPLIKAFEKLQHQPEMIVCDGHGIAHPRRLGLASHLGLIFDIPTIGCAKNSFIGAYKKFDWQRGAYSEILDNDQTIGVTLCTQTGIKPLFVSIGHKISLISCIDWILQLTPQYRQPETTRLADHLVREQLKHIH